MEVIGSNAIHPFLVRYKEPVDEEVAQQEFVACDVPEKEGLPLVYWESTLR